MLKHITTRYATVEVSGALWYDGGYMVPKFGPENATKLHKRPIVCLTA